MRNQILLSLALEKLDDHQRAKEISRLKVSSRDTLSEIIKSLTILRDSLKSSVVDESDAPVSQLTDPCVDLHDIAVAIDEQLGDAQDALDALQGTVNDLTTASGIGWMNYYNHPCP